ncbi:MAG: hypothetical protein LBK61_10880, partial [Spirochaetaceae bacterium]|nr:hypothetical protein [Spirochaetaceae bacterium]
METVPKPARILEQPHIFPNRESPVSGQCIFALRFFRSFEKNALFSRFFTIFRPRNKAVRLAMPYIQYEVFSMRALRI